MSTDMTTDMSYIIAMLDEVKKAVTKPVEVCEEWPATERKFIKELSDALYEKRVGYLIEEIPDVKKSILEGKDKGRLEMDMMLYFKHKARAYERELNRMHFNCMKRFDPDAFYYMDMGDLDYDEFYTYKECCEEEELVKHEIEDSDEYCDVSEDAKYEGYILYMKRMDELYNIVRGNEIQLRGVVYKK